MTRNEKVAVVDYVKQEFSNANSLVVCDFKGLGVKKLEDLRKSAKEQNVKVKVIKNTLAHVALKDTDKNVLSFKDTNIFVWGEDQLTVAKVVSKFEEKNDLFKIKTAFVDGEIASADNIKALSKLPSKDELIAMLLQVWNAPLQNFVVGLNALKNKKEQDI